MLQESRAAAHGERFVYTVSDLNRKVRSLLEREIALVWVEGELSNLSQPSSGHWYFSLKDRDAQVRCAMFRQRNRLVDFTPRPGQQVLARGRVSLYEPRGDFQIIVEHLEEAGVGALRREFERLKAKLATEGLFAEARKRSLPRYPQRIGVVTSPTGAAVRDILNILRRRYPPADVLIYPTPVQGAAAAPAIVEALTLASNRAECDVLILARGGGSLEDLWAFNEERVARAVHASRIPVIAGIGHEIDFTIADFVADARAPTPSGAAELATPDRAEVLQALAQTATRLGNTVQRELRALKTRLDSILARLKLAHPLVRIQRHAQRLDDLEQRLGGAMRGGLHKDRHRVSEALARLAARSPEHRVRDYRMRHAALAARLDRALADRLARAAHRLDLAERALNSVSPLATLSRGFAIVTRASNGKLLTDSSSVAAGEEIEARLAHGRLRARVVRKLPD